ncbi:hypothetical protein ACFWBN_06010 [Streptomyces sp. NPDC059989]|uniref:hypothetical protein n=1 Tax=Streptomyces sp. NPDC059989 TaxID=3347026 RepID=UPI00367E962E
MLFRSKRAPEESTEYLSVDQILERAVEAATASPDLLGELNKESEEELRRLQPQLLEGAPSEHAEWQNANLDLIKSSRPNFWVPLVIATVVVSALATVIYMSFVSDTRGWVGVLAVGVTLGLISSISSAAVTWVRRHENARLRLKGAEARLLQSLAIDAKGTLSSIINEQHERDQRRLPFLDSSDAPRLVELESTDTVESESVSSVIRFIKDHTTSAVGISGPRGVGKTTVMRRVCNDASHERLGVYLPIPVKYSSPEFIRLIHGEVARAVLKDCGADVSPKGETQRTAWVRSMVGLLVAVFGGGVIVLNHVSSYARLSAIDVFGLVLLVIGLGIYSLGLLASVRAGSSAHEAAEVRLARKVLQSLDFTSKHQHTSKNAFAVKFLTMEDQDQMELTERERTHPELVSDFKSFAARYHEITKKDMVLALDELDKMEKPGDALAFVNGMKDLLHVDHVHFVVSVSEDALHSFSLRGVPVRDAFDSSFDTVVPVRRFSLDESRELLKRRVLYFPDELALYCHALSGGLPRDLIRAARQCVDVRREEGVEVSVPEVVFRVTRRMGLSVAEAAIAKAREEGSSMVASTLGMRSGVDAAGDGNGLILALNSAAQSFKAEGEGTCLERSLEQFCCALSVVAAYFSQERTVEEWHRSEISRESERVASQVSRAMAALSADPSEAKSILSQPRTDAVVMAAVDFRSCGLR